MNRVVASTLAGLLLLGLLRWLMPLALPLTCALLLALLLSAPTEWLQRRGVPAGLAAALPVFGPAVPIAWAMIRFAPLTFSALRDSTAAAGRLAQPYAERADMVGAGARWTLAQLAWDDATLAAALGGATLPALLGVTVVLMLTFFLLLAQRSLLAGLLSTLATRRQRVGLARALVEARGGVARWFCTSALVNLGLGLATGGALALLGLPSAAGWAGVITALLFIPYAGPLLIMLLLAAAGSNAELGPVWPPLVFLGLHGIEANFINPWLMGRRLSISRPMLLVAVQAGAFAWGVGGAVLSVPILIVIHAALRVRPGLHAAKVLLAAEDGAAPSLQAAVEAAVRRPAPGPEPTPAMGERRIRVVARADAGPPPGRPHA